MVIRLLTNIAFFLIFAKEVFISMRRLFSICIFLCVTLLPLTAQRSTSFPVIEKGEIVIHHYGHSLSYDPEAMIPRWTAYTLYADDIYGDAVRPQRFVPDPAPELAGFPLAEHWHYSRSGWVRGHMVPAGDLKYDQQAMNDSFLTTNVCPMDQGFNNGIWKRLEEKVRKLADKFDLVYIITGPVIGENRFGKVGDSDILVPDAFYKALLVPYKGSYLSIGFYMPNEAAPRGAKLKDYAVTLAELENITGRIFFASIGPAFQIKEQLPLKELDLY